MATTEGAGLLQRNVRRLRDEAGLTREQLAARAEVTTSTIFRIESEDDYEPRMSSVTGIARALGCRVADLFLEPNGGDTEPETKAS
jgi:DNA-binding XRE family transcriptional regulator